MSFVDWEKAFYKWIGKYPRRCGRILALIEKIEGAVCRTESGEEEETEQIKIVIQNCVKIQNK